MHESRTKKLHQKTQPNEQKICQGANHESEFVQQSKRFMNYVTLTQKPN